MLTEYKFNDELYHHGIKGQKWGRRRFQDESGKLTAAGRERYKAYKSDYKTAVKLNRKVAASQKHLKEEGVMLDRVRDKYLKTNLKYQREMSKSSGLFGSKSVAKAERVARAQNQMDKVAGDYNQAAGAFGVAKKIASNDSKALRDQVDHMIKTYGKGSIGSIETKTVKMGQSKLQKLMQGAPASIILNKSRETEQFIKTGVTLANMPIIGNFYTARHVGNAELDMNTKQVNNAINTFNPKRATGKKDKPLNYLSDDYFDDASSVSSKTGAKRRKLEKQVDDAYSDAERAEKAWERSAKIKDNMVKQVNDARNDMEVAKELTKNKGISKTSIARKIVTGHPISAAGKTIARTASKANYASKKRRYNRQLNRYQSLIKTQDRNIKAYETALGNISNSEDKLARFEGDVSYKMYKRQLKKERKSKR